MPITVENLRRWIVLAALLVVSGIVALLLYGRHERRKLLHDLPQKLGIDIQQQTSEFTYSQSVQGHTLFTLHAAKAVQMKDGGHIKLHDVTITLYGRKQDRADRIAGQEFEYNPATGIAQAQGEVYLDLQTPTRAVAAGSAPAAADATRDLGTAGMVHVTTSGLSFDQKKGIATTDQPIAFAFGGGKVTGQARGAQYDSDQGLVTLYSAVTAVAVQHGRAVHVTAAHAVMNRDTNLCAFTQATYTASGQTASADRALVQMRSDGSAQQVQMTGHVLLSMAGGGSVQAPRAVMELNDVSEPRDLRADEGVHYMDDEIGPVQRQAQGDAENLHVVFDGQGIAETAEFRGGVHTLAREKDKSAAGWTERELQSAAMLLTFRNRDGSAEMQNAVATGNARMRFSGPVGQKLAQRRTDVVEGDSLQAAFAAGTTTPQSVHGMGHTVLTQTAADGSVNVTRGEMLDVQMRAAAKSRGAHAFESTIERAVQQGSVTLTQAPAPSQKNAQPLKATGERVDYTGTDDTLVLTGTAAADPQVADGGMQAAAKSIRMQRTSGDATLIGDVRGNYASGPQQPLAHVVADHATLRRADQHMVFYGNAMAPARLWQAASQVEAATLDFDHKAQRLTAFGRADDATAVHAVLAYSMQPASSKQGEQVMRLASRKMVYNEAKAQAGGGLAEFTGGVTVETGDGTIAADHADVYLAQSASSAKAAKMDAAPALPALDGRVQRIMAAGQVKLQTGTRQGSGEQLVYTPAEGAPVGTRGGGEFVLTGTTAAPPTLMDPEKGSIRGASLRFNAGDDSVVISGGGSAGRVQTELKVDR